MKAKIIFLYFTIILTFITCGNKIAIKEKAFTFDKFPIESYLNESNYLEIESIKVDGFMLYQDSLLIIRNAANSSKWHFSVTNLNSKTYITNILESGRQPEQAMGFLSYGIFDQNLWVYDIIKNQVIIGNLDSIADGNTRFNQNMSMPSFYYAAQLTNSQELIGSGDYQSDYWITKIDLSNGLKTKQFGPYTTDPDYLWTTPQKMAYESFLFLKSSNDKCVVAGRYSDRIQIFDLNTGSSKIIKGPENYEPELLTLKGNDGKELSVRGQNTRYAFVKGKTTDQYIYLLYSGNNHESQHLHYGKYIYVYDWNGTPVKKITLSDYMLDFVISSDDSKLYTYNPKTKYIMHANL